MNKAIDYLQGVVEHFYEDFEEKDYVLIKDAEKACQLAYNEAIDACKRQLTLVMEHHPLTDIRDLTALNKLKQ